MGKVSGTGLTSEERLREALRVRELPWDLNEHGLWCLACGNLLAAPHNIDEDYEPPETCRQCGFPDFEEGTGYFTDDDDDQPTGDEEEKRYEW